MDEYDPGKRIGLYVDEWGIWTDVEPGTNPGFLFQQNSMRDALIASTTLDIFNRNASRVKMANIAQTVNVLQSMILTQGNKMVKTPTYYVFNMYKVHSDAFLLKTNLITENYTYGNESIPAVSQTVSKSKDGRIHISLSNVNPNREIGIKVEILGKTFTRINDCKILTAPELNSVNTFENPEIVKTEGFKSFEILSPGSFGISLPPKSVVTLELE
jgi:alpha-N-arabinofuranosidase